MTQSDFQLTTFILAPVSSVFAAAFLKNLATNIFVDPMSGHDFQVTISFSCVAIGLTSFFGFLIIYWLYEYKSGQIIAPDDLKFRLLWTELTIGGFLGTLVEPLFGSTSNKIKTPPIK